MTISYAVGGTDVLESPGAIFVPRPGDNSGEAGVFTRTLQIGQRNKDSLLVVATHRDPTARIRVAGRRRPFRQRGVARASSRAGRRYARYAIGLHKAMVFVCEFRQGKNRCAWDLVHAEAKGWPVESLMAAVDCAKLSNTPFRGLVRRCHPAAEVAADTDQRSRRGRQQRALRCRRAHAPGHQSLAGASALYWIGLLSRRGPAVVCAWDGDVWLVHGLSKLERHKHARATTAKLSWQRIASGLFQPLGIKIVDGKIYVTCRDQLVILRDPNDDGETDFYECFNNDHQVTEHFHEFAMGLQTDANGNFYYAKSARHALPAVVPHHGTLLRMSARRRADRHPGHRLPRRQRRLPESRRHLRRDRSGRPLEPQEPHQLGQARAGSTATCSATRRDRHVGRSDGAAVVLDHQRLRPLARRTALDPKGRLGSARRFASQSLVRLWQAVRRAAFEEVDGTNRAACATSHRRASHRHHARPLHPHDRQLYICGMFAWAGSVTQPGGLYRIRYTGRAMHQPVSLQAKRGALAIPLPTRSIKQPRRSQKATAENLVAETDCRLRLKALWRKAARRRMSKELVTTAKRDVDRTRTCNRHGAWRSSAGCTTATASRWSA